MPKHAVEVLECLPFERGTLLGFAKIRVKELRLLISGVAIHPTGESRWVQLPSKPMLQNDRPIRGPDGCIRSAKIPELETDEVRRAFNTAVLDAYDSYRPP